MGAVAGELSFAAPTVGQVTADAHSRHGPACNLCRGTVANAWNATSMSLAMTAAAMDNEGDCTGYPENDGTAGTCNLAGVDPFATLQAETGTGFPPLWADIANAMAKRSHGHTGPPEPYPPRITILS
jgi:hypothetical protein